MSKHMAKRWISEGRDTYQVLSHGALLWIAEFRCGTMTAPSIDDARTNAALAAHAVNNHEDLVEAMEGLIEHFDWGGEIPEEELAVERKLRPDRAKVFEAARAALAKAKEQ